MAKRIVAELTVDILKSRLHYNPETGIFTRLESYRGHKAGEVAGWVNGDGYLNIKIFGKIYKAHRLAWLYVYGEWPSLFIDHINRCKTDNRIQNLRDVERSENGRNRGEPSNNVSGRSGVHWVERNRRWCARVAKHGKRFYLGYFEQKEDAIRARDEWWERNPVESRKPGNGLFY